MKVSKTYPSRILEQKNLCEKDHQENGYAAAMIFCRKKVVTGRIQLNQMSK